jgi:hypothetical protein
MVILLRLAQWLFWLLGRAGRPPFPQDIGLTTLGSPPAFSVFMPKAQDLSILQSSSEEEAPSMEPSVLAPNPQCAAVDFHAMVSKLALATVVHTPAP